MTSAHFFEKEIIMAKKKTVKKYVSVEPNLDKDSRDYHAMFGWPKEDEKSEKEDSKPKEKK